MKRITMLLGAGILMLCSTLFAAVPQLINFQGVLKDGSGNPVANGLYSVQFTIYDAASGGTNLWSETQSVSTTSGLFSALLGSTNPVPDSAFTNPNRFLGMKVDADPEMTPRQQLVSVGFAFRVSSVDGASGGAIFGNTSIQSDLTVSGNVGLPTSTATTGIIKAGASRFIHNYGSSNTFVGANAGNLAMTGAFNTANGARALLSNTAGVMNAAVGVEALYQNTGGNYNTAIGGQALYSNTTGIFNTANGWEALYLNTGSSNTANGAQALYLNTTGSVNTAVGIGALYHNTTADSNTATGSFALSSNTTGIDNTANGFGALNSNTTGNFNTAIGHRTLYNATAGDNTATGAYALYSNATGNDNTAIGMQALYSNFTGNFNTANGVQALSSNTSGDNNTAIGRYALQSNTTGSENTAVGYLANVSAGNLTNATAVGRGAVVNASNKIRLGDGAVTIIEGQVAYTFTSDKNEKENFQPVDGGEVLRKIRGFDLESWNYKGQDPRQFRHYGPVAQEFFAAFGHDGIGQSGDSTTINSGDMTGILMIAVQRLGNENADLKARIEQLEEKLAAMQAKVE